MIDNTPVRIYYYYDFTDTVHFCRRLEQRFRETGHERPLEFINHVRKEKLLDCLDLLEIMTEEEFIFNLCLQEDRLQYMLPPCMGVYGRLAEIDPIYDRLYRQLLPEENGVFRYGKSFYEELYRKSDKILESLMTV